MSAMGLDERQESPEGPDIVALAKQMLSSITDFAYRIVTSKWLHMAILRVFLTLSFITFVYWLAVPAYVYFYNVYLPDQIITAPLHLQYGFQIGESRNPFAIASLTHKTIKTLQPYDVDVTLTLPPSPENLAVGNFMVGLLLLGDPAPIPNQQPSNTTTSPLVLVTPIDPIAYRAARPTLHASLRPTRLPYRSRLTSLAASLLRLPYYALYPDAELKTLVVPMAERLAFPRGAPVPRSALVEIQPGGPGKAPPEVSAAHVTLRTRLGGLRWLMYHYRVTSFVVFTAMFLATAVWCFLVTFTVGGLVVSRLTVGGGLGGRRLVPGAGKGGESDGESDEELGGLWDPKRRLLGRTGEAEVKDEEEGEGAGVKDEGDGVEVKVEEEEDPGVEAGDEEDVVVGGIVGEQDSGIGTSYSEATGRERARRRVSGKGKEVEM